ncbi:hypothetical protein Tco_1048542 [Tanacetum coccineum]
MVGLVSWSKPFVRFVSFRVVVFINLIPDSIQIKDSFHNFFKDKFQVHDSLVVFLPLSHSNGLSSFVRDVLETLASLEEIKTSDWDCGSSKTPCLDGFAFTFVKKYWDIINKDIFEYVNSFLASNTITQGANSSFFTLIPKGFTTALVVLINGASQSRQQESRKPPIAELFDIDSGRISIVTVNTKEYHSDVLTIITRIMRRTLDNNMGT